MPVQKIASILFCSALLTASTPVSTLSSGTASHPSVHTTQAIVSAVTFFEKKPLNANLTVYRRVLSLSLTLRNSHNQSLSDVLLLLKNTNPHLFISIVKYTQRITFKVKEITLLKLLYKMTGRFFIRNEKGELRDFADQVMNMDNNQLLEISIPFFVHFKDMEELTFAAFLDRLSEVSGQGLQHHIVNPLAKEITARAFLKRKSDPKIIELLNETLRWQIILNEIIFRWDLPTPSQSVYVSA